MLNLKKEIKLQPEKKHFLNKTKDIFTDKKKRYLYMALIILPFAIAIGIFGVIVFKEAKELIGLATGTSETNPNYEISSMNYVLRDNATEIQEEYFIELKTAIEGSEASDEQIAGLVCKNFVTDFYTWTNKQGQYDVGGLYYVYDGESETGNFKTQLYLQARDGFYKYISNYITDYGSENLLEVNYVEVTKANKLDDYYIVTELISKTSSETEAYTYDYVYDEVGYEAYEVTCTWTYKESEKFATSKYPTKCNFIVIYRNGRFEIVEASENTINVRKVEIINEESEAESEYSEE